MTTYDRCPRCLGRGYLPEARKPSRRNPNARACPRCQGRGALVRGPAVTQVASTGSQRGNGECYGHPASLNGPGGTAVAMILARITGADHGIVPSLRDAAILADRVVKRDVFQGPRIGDFVLFADGSEGRFTHDWGDTIQTTVRGGKFGYGSHYMTKSGGISYSGALDPGIDKRRLVATEETRPGAVWFFHDDWAHAHSAVYAEIPCRVYRELQPGEA